MFEKIYMHSKFEQKRNKVWGVREYIRLLVMGFPFILIGISAFAYFNRPLSGVEFTVVFTSVLVVWVLIEAIFALNYIKNCARVFAVTKNKKIYVMNMSKEAASYLSLHTAMQGMKAAATQVLDDIEESDMEKNIQSAGLCIDNISRVVNKRSKVIIYGDFGKETKLVIPRIYSEMDELESYFKYMTDDSKEEFHFHKKTKEDVLNERIKKNPNKIFISILLVVMWLFLFNFASDLNRFAHIKYNYIVTDAVVEVVKKDETSELEVSYEIDDVKINELVKVDDNDNYSKGDTIRIYYNKDNVNDMVLYSSVGFLIKPFVVLLAGLEILALLIRILFGKK